MPVKNTSENVVCLSHQLHILVFAMSVYRQTVWPQIRLQSDLGLNCLTRMPLDNSADDKSIERKIRKIYIIEKYKL